GHGDERRDSLLPQHRELPSDQLLQFLQILRRRLPLLSLRLLRLLGLETPLLRVGQLAEEEGNQGGQQPRRRAMPGNPDGTPSHGFRPLKALYLPRRSASPTGTPKNRTSVVEARRTRVPIAREWSRMAACPCRH